MRRFYFLLIFCAFFFTNSFTQIRISATWMSGDNTFNQPAVYGTKGVADPVNKPGARRWAASWTDAAGNLWLFGGHGFSIQVTEETFLLNDLWKYNPATNEWTWVSGDNAFNQQGVYGTKGVADLVNKPGAREGCVSWIDAAGNFWLWGGIGYASSEESNYLSDLWMFNPTTGQWTWVSGDNTLNQSGVYGTKGVASSSNKPGGRGAAFSWTDAAGNFWLMGGGGFASDGTGYLNDLWMFSSTTNQWTWVSGDNTAGLPANASEHPGVYGTKGVADPANKPGGRQGAVTWTDASGNFWLMGGAGYTTGTQWGYLNDLWMFNPTTGEWTWVSGDNTANQPGVYGTKGMASPSNKPGGRHAAISWTDSSGNLWLMGGQSFPSIDALNDLWMFNPTTNVWTWVSGDNVPGQSGVYGTKGVSDPANKPGARIAAVSWTDGSGNFWLLGGYTVNNGTFEEDNHLNDLWKITIANTNAPLVISIEDKTVYEAEGKVEVRVALSHVFSQDVMIKYATLDGTATSHKCKGAQEDYKSKKGVMKIPAGQSFGVITVDVNSCDATDETDEFFTIALSLASKTEATLGDGTARITIKNGAAPGTTGKKASACSCKSGQNDRLSVKVGPNPSRHRFAIETKSSSNDWMEIQVTDHQSGRVVEWMHRVAANSTIYLGENYRPGVYYVKVRQGENVEILRLIKQE